MAYEYSLDDINAELAKRQPVNAAPQSEAKSYEYSQSDIDAELTKRQGMSRGEAAFTTLTNPLGMGARAKAGIAAGVAKTFGGEFTKDVPFSELYNEQLGTEQQNLAQAREQYPIQSLGTQLFSDIGVAGKALKAVGLTSPTIGTAAKGGAFLSGTSALGETQDLTNIPQVAKEVGLSSLIGAGAGAAISSIAPVIGSIPKRIADRLFKTEAERIVEKTISPEVAKQGLDMLKQAPAESPTVALDIDTPEFQSLLKNVVSKSPQAKRIAADFANGRKDQALNRIGEALSKDISPVENAFQSIDELTKNRNIAAEPFRVKAYEEGSYIPTKSDLKDAEYQVTSKRIAELKKNPELFSKKNKELASEFNELEGDSRIKRYIGSSIKDNEIKASVNSVEMLHDVRKQIDADIRGLKNSVLTLGGRGETAAASQSELHGLEALRKRLNKIMYKAAPAMEVHDKIFAETSDLILATKEGLDFAKTPYQELNKKLREMPQARKEAYRIGARQDIMDTAEKAAKQTGKSAPAEAIINKQYNRKQIEALFDSNSEKGAQFVKKLSEEIRYDQTIKNLGLNKAEVESSNNGLINMLARVAAGSKTGMVYEGAKAAEIAMLKQYKGLNKSNAQALVKAFTNKERGQKILQNIAKKSKGEQGVVIDNIIRDLYPVLGKASVPELEKQNFISEVNAAENPEAKKALQEMQQMRQQIPSSYTPQETEKMDLITKNRLYR